MIIIFLIKIVQSTNINFFRFIQISEEKKKSDRQCSSSSNNCFLMIGWDSDLLLFPCVLYAASASLRNYAYKHARTTSLRLREQRPGKHYFDIHSIPPSEQHFSRGHLTSSRDNATTRLRKQRPG